MLARDGEGDHVAMAIAELETLSRYRKSTTTPPNPTLTGLSGLFPV